MTRTEAIAIINAQLACFDDERIMTVAEIVQDMSVPVAVPLRLSAEELAGIEQSKEDFKAGRTYSVDEARAISDAFLLSLKTKYPAAP